MCWDLFGDALGLKYEFYAKAVFSNLLICVFELFEQKAMQNHAELLEEIKETWIIIMKSSPKVNSRSEMCQFR